MPSPNGLSPSVAHCPRSDRRARAAAAVSHVAVAAAIMLLWRRHGSNVLVEKTAGKKRHFARGGRRRMGGGGYSPPPRCAATSGAAPISLPVNINRRRSSPFVAVYGERGTSLFQWFRPCVQPSPYVAVIVVIRRPRHVANVLGDGHRTALFQLPLLFRLLPCTSPTVAHISGKFGGR